MIHQTNRPRLLSNGVTSGFVAAPELNKPGRRLAAKPYSNFMSNLQRKFVKPVTKRSGTTLY